VPPQFRQHTFRPAAWEAALAEKARLLEEEQRGRVPELARPFHGTAKFLLHRLPLVLLERVASANQELHRMTRVKEEDGGVCVLFIAHSHAGRTLIA